MSLRNTITHIFGPCEYVCLCVSVQSEVSSAGRNSHPARSKQRPLVMLDPGVWVTERLSRGERKPGESKITLLRPDMTVNWAQGFWVSRLPRLHTQLFSEGPNDRVKIRPRNYKLRMNVIIPKSSFFILSNLFSFPFGHCHLPVCTIGLQLSKLIIFIIN